MDFSSPEYLPNSQRRLEHLRRIINGRPVAILAAGPSINQLEERINELRDADICYFGMNSFFIQEKHILQKIGRHFSMVMAGINRGLPPIIDKIEEFLQRSEKNIFSSSFFQSQPELLSPNFSLEDFINKYNSKLLFIGIAPKQSVPDNNRPLHFLPGNTLAQLTYLAVISGASKIILFGADGATLKSKNTYYRQQEYGSEPMKALIRDTYQFFNPVVSVTIPNIYNTYQLKPIEILNCSEKSFYTPFPTISYDHAIAYLNNQEKYNPSWNLRPNIFIRAKRELVLFRLPETKKNLNRQVRGMVKFILPRSWFLALHRRLRKWRPRQN